MSEIVVASNTGPLVSAFQCGRIRDEAAMSKIYQVKPHEPEEELLSAEDAWEDFLSLRQALDGRQIPAACPNPDKSEPSIHHKGTKARSPQR